MPPIDARSGAGPLGPVLLTIPLLGALVGAALPGCSRGEPAPPDPATDPAAAGLPEDDDVAAPAAILAPIDPIDAGSTIVLASLMPPGARPQKRLVYAADADGKRIFAFDPVRREELSQTALDGSPAQAIVGPDGRLYVALRDRHEVVALEATGAPNGALSARWRIETASEPVALAIQRREAGARLLVVSGWGHRLEAFELSTRRRSLSVDLPREPRAIALSEDGGTAFIAHMVGSMMSAVDLEGGERGEGGTARSIPLGGADLAEDHSLGCALPMAGGNDSGGVTGGAFASVRSTPRSSLQGFAVVRLDDRLLAPGVLVRTGDPRSRTGGYGEIVADLPSHLPDVAVVGAASEKATFASTHVNADAAAHAGRRRSCLLPRAAAADPARRSLFVACLDIDVILELDADKPDPARAEKRRYMVAVGPTGIALDAEREEGFVWSQFERTISVMRLEPRSAPPMARGARQTAAVPLGQGEGEGEGEPILELGRRLFHMSGESGISRDGRACASCHPDGRDDGLTWPSPVGPRQPPMLAGRLHGSAPYSWAGDHGTLREHVTQTFARLGGKGLAASALDALVTYVEAMPGPPRREAEPDALAERGRALFVSNEVGCAMCHREGPAWTDGALHDVESSAAADRFSTFDTPSLRFVGGTSPYFHDGRYGTLRALLAATDGKMGNTGQLGEADLAALEAYVLSL